MTAEIAIINRGAVALAADSAMTLQVRGQEKIYTSADKVFELSRTQPIGVMVYNNLEFMGVPLELAIKQFRDLKACTVFDTVEQASSAFFEYLKNDLKPDESIEKNHAIQVIYPIFTQISKRFNREIRRHITNIEKKKIGKKRTKKDLPDFAAIFVKVGNDFLRQFDEKKLITEISDDDFRLRYKDIIDEAIRLVFVELPLDDSDKNLLESVAFSALRSCEFSDSRTGIIFAGFGNAEMFPALHAYEIDGIVLGTLKCNKTRTVATQRNTLSAEIIPFAQREMVDRFMFGVDPEFEVGVIKFVERLLRSTGTSIIDHSGVRKLKADELRQKLKEAVKESVDSLKNNLIPEAKQKFREQVEDMVLFMPKPELASLAEALINITSVKRKFSAEQETVAGPVDVAVISKNDGFVWVKRKHYFDSRLNPRYLWRKQSEISGVVGQ